MCYLRLCAAAINGRFVGVWGRLSWCVCFVTPDNTEMAAHLAASKGLNVCLPRWDLLSAPLTARWAGKRRPWNYLAASHSGYTTPSTSWVVHGRLLLPFASWKPATVDECDYTFKDRDVTRIPQKPNSVEAQK